MLELRRAPARPRQAVIVALGGTILRPQRHQIEVLLVRHVQLEPLGRLAGVTGRPAAAIDLAQDVLRRHDAVLDLDVLEHAVGKAELLRQHVHDVVVVLRFEDRLDDLLAPLDRAVRSGARAVALELGADRQEISAVLALAEHRPSGGMRVGNDQQLKCFDAFCGFRHAGHGVAAVPEDHHGLQIVFLLDLIPRQRDGVEPACRRDAGRLHHLLGFEARLHPVVVDLPDPAPMLPGAFGEAVVERQVADIETEIGRALHVAVAAENVGAVAEAADIAGRQQQDAERAHVGGADGVLGRAHAPDQRRRLLLGEFFGHALELRLRHAGDALDFVRRPLLDLLADIVHAVDALLDELLVLPAVLEDVPEHAPDHRNVGAGTDAHEVGRVRGGAGEPRLDHDQVGAIELLAFEQVLQRDRMRFRRIAAHDDHGLGVADVVVAVGHRAVAPGIGYARDRGRVTDTRLVIDRVRAPERRQLAIEIGALVGELRRTQPIDRLRTGLLANLRQLVADLVDRLLPADPRPLAVDELHRVLQPPVAMHEFAHRGALGAMRAAIDRAVPARLLADPHAVRDFGDDRAADRAVGADVLADRDLRAGGRRRTGLRLAYAAERQRTDGREASGRQSGAAQERPAIEPAFRLPLQSAGKRTAASLSFGSLDQHACLLSSDTG